MEHLAAGALAEALEGPLVEARLGALAAERLGPLVVGALEGALLAQALVEEAPRPWGRAGGS